MKKLVAQLRHITFRNIMLFNLILWTVSFLLFLIVFTEDGKPKTIDYIYTASFLVTIIIPVTINFYVLIPFLLKKEKYLWYTLAFLINVIVFTQINIWFFEYFIDFLFTEYYFISYHSNIRLLTIFGVFLTVSTLLKLSVDWFYFNSNENRKLKKQNQQIQTQLTLLRSQINPHFLFNSLNVIYALAIENKPKTKDAIVQLSDILRYVIYDSGTERVAIKEEVTLIKNFIHFHQFRHRETENIKFNYSIDDENYLIYPMLLLPLIENSFKYGLRSDVDDPYIHIDLQLKDNDFIFTIENNYSEIATEYNNHSGVGIKNIKKNLELVYPKEHEFEMLKKEHLFRITLKLFTNEN